MATKDDLRRRYGSTIRAAADSAPPAAPPAPVKGPPVYRADRAAVLIPLADVVADPAQPRKHFGDDELRNLADSIREQGQQSAVGVVWSEPLRKCVLVYGERRWRAARLAGVELLRARLYDDAATAEEIKRDRLVENLLREDLKPFEQMLAFEEYRREFGLTQKQLAERLHVSQAVVSRALTTARQLDEALRPAVDAGALGPEAAYYIARETDPAVQHELAAEVQAGQLAPRDVPRARAASARHGARPVRTAQETLSVAGGTVTVRLAPLTDGTLLAALEDAAAQVRRRVAATAA